MYNRKAFKREAKELMRESTPHYMLVMLVYILLTTGLSYVVTALTDVGGIATGAIGMFLNVLISLFSMVMVVGLAYYTLNLTRGKPTAVGDLFEGFSFAGRSIGANLLVMLYTFLWMLLPATVFSLVVGLIVVIAEDAVALAIILAVVAYIGLMVAAVAIVLRYSMVSFALAENPDEGASAAIRRSVKIMKGNKGKLFVLELSFIGWILLSALIVLVVLGIGVLISGVDWFASLFQSVGSDPLNAYTMTMELIGSMTLWTIIAEVVCLPLTLWLTAYQQTTFARFYNYVCGYDYHQYMNEGWEGNPDDTRSESVPVEYPGDALPESAPVEHPVSPTPPGGFYTPAPKLDDEPTEETETAADEPEEASETEEEE